MRKRRILSLLLAVAVMATMLVAVPLTASAEPATKDSYAEWYVYGSSSISSSSPYNKENIDSIISDSDDTKPVYKSIGEKYSNTNVKEPVSITFSAYGDALAQEPKQHTIPASSTNTLKLETSTDVQIDTKFSALKAKFGFDSYNLMVVYGVRYSSNKGGVTVKNKEDTALGTETEIAALTATAAAAEETHYAEIKKLTDDEIHIKRDGAEGRLYYVGIKYNIPSTEKKINILQDSYAVPLGESVQIETETENLEDETLKWESDTVGVATVDNGLVTGQGNGKAKITVSTQDGSVSDSCEVVVSESKNVVVTFGTAITNAKLSADGEGETVELKPGNNTIKYGTYRVSYDIAAPKTYIQDGIPETFEVKANVGGTLNLATKYNTVEKEFPESVYTAMKGKTITWGFGSDVSTTYPASFKALSDVSGKENYIPIAGAIDKGTEDSEVYMTVKGDKLNASGRTSPNFQFNDNTTLTIPVVPGSVVKIVNNAKDKENIADNKSNTVYTIEDSTGFNKTYGEVKSGGRTTVYEQDYVYSGADNGYVTITATSGGGGFLTLVSVTSNDPSAYFGKSNTDCGAYMDGGTKKGVIRFLQSYVGSGVTSYGIYFVNPEGAIDKAKINNDGDITKEGIIADLYGIDSGDNGTYSAMAYVVVDGKTIWSNPISRSIDNWDNVKVVEKDPSY